MKRLFLSLDIDERLKHELSDITAKLPNDEWRIVPLANLHITLLFIGNVEDELINGVRSRLRDLKFKPFSITFSKVVVRSKGHDGLIWYQGEPSESFSLLSELAAQSLEVTPDHKPLPHITIARKKRYRKTGLSGDIHRANHDVHVTGFKLMSSELRKEDPVYRELEFFPATKV